MKTTHLVSKILFYITRFLAVLYFALAAYSALALTTGWFLNFREGGKYFQICYPFTNHPLMLGDYNTPYIIFEFLSPLSLYGLFFLLISNVFKVFFQPKLFTQNGITHLRQFYLANLFIPGIVILLSSIFVSLDNEVAIFIVLHFMLGIFAYFLAAIFKQGLSLQNEQDLFI
ncbi:DUF2975 domain-containing protein [Flavobacterium sp. Fl-318]|uniref:DUF2975 domain-containing protein n=1 Tax=Flavobacterium cupriresistens TaxID=2893885 RepID=A0ABU4RB31_9FLAO|nr:MULTISPECIES: DUF2975 domain-containing protein [unclassified Flavobacterium]MDX6188655.1 DUF2975 domain-containing protein [Flavobacterium sp. Fl-318]UFH44556.1 DUF2975 domain-containing protein [Flavobacterium sp. F-323]